MIFCSIIPKKKNRDKYDINIFIIASSSKYYNSTSEKIFYKERSWNKV